MTNVTQIFLIWASLAFTIVLGKFSRNIIKTDKGQIYECVALYKQPAFKDPSLNLKIADSYLTKIQQQNNTNGLGLKGRGCPIGTVPILALPNPPAHLDDIVSQPGSPPPKPQAHCSARVQTRANNPTKKYFGANAGISVYNPTVQGNQWSSARFKVLNGAESIEAGWMVNPGKFKDNEAHLYASFNAGGKGCINLDCPGFVQVSTDIPLGISPHAYSSKKQQIVWNLSIDKHQDDGNWWLSIKTEKHQIGYWPNNLFRSLANGANQVEFGGEINDPNAISPPPSMGNGLKAVYNTKDSSCFYHATVVNENFQNIDPPDTEKFSNCEALYTVLDGGHQSDPELGRLIFYGGPYNQ